MVPIKRGSPPFKVAKAMGTPGADGVPSGVPWPINVKNVPNNGSKLPDVVVIRGLSATINGGALSWLKNVIELASYVLEPVIENPPVMRVA